MRLEGMVLSKGAVAGHPNPLTVCWEPWAVSTLPKEGGRGGGTRGV